MAFSAQFLDELRARVGLADVISKRVKLTRRGREHLGLCLFHKEKTPSFTVNEEKGFYHCFGCQAHGSVIDFVMETENLSFPEAVERLAAGVGMEIPCDTPEEREHHRKRQTLLGVMEMAAAHFEKTLRMPEGRAALDYLKGRGLDGTTISRFRLGLAPEGRGRLRDALAREGVTPAQMVATGLLIQPDDDNGERREAYDRFRRRVIFPILDRRGRPIAFGGRILGDGKPKYLNSPETPLFRKGCVLYNLNQAAAQARKADTIVVTEGYMDVIALDRVGFTHAVAPLGTALTEDQIQLLWRVVREPVLCFDGDEAGRNAALKNAGLFLASKAEAQVVTLPHGEDPDTFLLKNGAEALRGLLAEAKPLLEFLVQETLARMPNSVQGRMRAVEELVPLLAQIPQQDRRQLTLVALADQLKVSPEVLLRKLPESLHSENENAKPIHSAHTESSRTDEWWVVQALLAQGQLWSLARQYLLPEEMQDPRLRHIYSRLMQLPPDLLYPLTLPELNVRIPNCIAIWPRCWPRIFWSVIFRFLVPLPTGARPEEMEPENGRT